MIVTLATLAVSAVVTASAGDPLAVADGGITAAADAAPSVEPQASSPAPAAAAVPATLSQPGVSLKAAFGEGATVQAGDFKLNVRARVQVRGLELTEPRTEELFIRRARVNMKATWRDVSFVMQLGFAQNDLEADAPNPLRDAYISWSRFRDLNVRVGQMKVPFDRQRITSSSSLQLADRSIVVLELNLDRDVGLQVFSDDLFGWHGRLGYSLAVMGGDGRNRLGKSVGWLFAGRLSFRPFGAFDEASEGDLQRESRVRLAIGLAAARNNNTLRDKSTFGATYTLGGFNYTHAAADVQLKAYGFSLLSQVLYRQADQSEHTADVGGTSVTEKARSAYGWFVQAGYCLPYDFEVVGRYGDLVPLNGAFKRSKEMGGGLNWYPHGHDLKVQLDYFYLLTEAATPAHQVRLQVQLFF